MTACNMRPPEGHPMHDWGVACHLAADHLDYGEAHSWDIDAAVARHEIVTGALAALRERFPGREIERFDNGIPHPIVVYEAGWICEDCGFSTDDAQEALAHSDKRKHSLAHGRLSKRPYRTWDQHAGPWLLVTYKDPELAERRASAPEQIDNSKLYAGSPMYYYCKGCGHQTAELPEDWWRDPPPVLCDWCRAHDGPEYAIWKVTGAVYRVGLDGAVDEDPIIAGHE